MKHLIALLALWLSACPQSFNSQNTTVTPSSNKTQTTEIVSEPTSNPVAANPDKDTKEKVDNKKNTFASVVLETLNVSPTPGLEKKDKYRERGGLSGLAGTVGGYGGALADMEADSITLGEGRATGIARPAEAPMAKPSKSMIAPAPPMPPGRHPVPPIRPPVQARLTAGEVDDNKNFADYVKYLKKDLGGPAHKIDVSQRIKLTIVDGDKNPIHDAKVTLLVEEKPWLVARSHSNGQVVMFPHAAGTLPKGKQVNVRIEKDGVSIEREIDGFSTEEKISLSGFVKKQEETRLDLVFCIDTTGSMGDEIAQIQSTIQDIISKTASLSSKPSIRLGMVLYGDRGDAYVTRTYDFTTDPKAFKDSISKIQMTGGGDTPEDLNSGIEDTIEALEWENRDAVRLVFLIGDAAPHMDYQQQYDYKVAALRAAEKGIKIFPLASSGLEDVGEYVFRQLALFTEGRFLFLTYGAGGGTSMHVDRQDYTPDKLDDLVIKIISDELAPLAK